MPDPSGVVAVTVVVVLVPVLLVVLLLFFLLVGLVVARPALRLRGALEVELVPGIEVHLLDVAVLVLDFDDLFVRIDRQHPEDLVLFEILKPLSLNRVVVSGHANTSKKPGDGSNWPRNIRGIRSDCQAWSAHRPRTSAIPGPCTGFQLQSILG